MERGSEGQEFRVQRRAGIGFIAGAMPVAIALWIAIDRLAPPIPGMAGLQDRMVFTLKCVAMAVLFCLASGVEAVAHERLSSPAFDPLAGFVTRRLRVNQRYLQNTLEQTVIFAAGLFGLALYCPSGAAMRAVLATTVVWIAARFAFWIGYHQSAAMRGLGAPGMAMSLIVLLYVASRFGDELAGPAGAVGAVVLFILFEAALFWATRPGGRRGQAGPDEERAQENASPLARRSPAP
ncbi:MAG: MAPEG family protein [Caulobacteraceae bacterium]